MDIVFVKDGRLWSQFGKDEDEDEYLPLGAESFFIKCDLGSVTFSRDAQRHVTGYTDHRVEDRKSTSKDQLNRQAQCGHFRHRRLIREAQAPQQIGKSGIAV